MAVLKGLKQDHRSESMSKGFMIDTVRGVLRVRKWPKKRGTPKSPLQLWWIDWFRQANLLAKYVDAHSARRAIEITKGMGMYPRDVLLSAMRGRLYIWQDQTGKVWHSMASIQDISESLDVLAQDIGNVLVRATDRWRKALPELPGLGHVLTYQGPTAPPIWAAGGGGLQQLDLPGTPIIPDNTVSEYLFDVTGYAEIAIIINAVTLAAAHAVQINLSIDGGVSWKEAGGDYMYVWTSASWDNSGNDWRMLLTDGDDNGDHRGGAILTGIQTARALKVGQGGKQAANAAALLQATNFDGPITDLKIRTSGGSNFTGGLICLMGKTV